MITICITTQGREMELNRLLNAPAFSEPILQAGARVSILMQGEVFPLESQNHNISIIFCPVLLSEAEARQRQVIHHKIRDGLKPEDVLIFLDDDVQAVAPDWWQNCCPRSSQE
jgi:hypothetical protein